MSNPTEVVISWVRQDVEQRLGFSGARHTRANSLLTLIMGGVLASGFYAMLLPFRSSYFSEMLTQRGPTPYVIVFFFMWSLAIVFIKWRKLAMQLHALSISVVPERADFVLSPTTVHVVLDKIYSSVDDPRHFVVFNRIVFALSNLRNLGRVSDVDEIMRSQAEQDESSMETSYSLLRGFIWAIPVLGFIGTVLGLSEAIGGFGAVLAETSEVSEITAALKVVTGGLATAFETTLIALLAALVLQLLVTFLKKNEEEFLDACSDYCVRQIVSRLRVIPFERESD